MVVRRKLGVGGAGTDADESTGTVLVALGANAAVAVAKTVAGRHRLSSPQRPRDL